MKSNNRFNIFLITLSLLFWNPLSFFLVYGQTQAYVNPYLYSAIWIIFMAGILTIISLILNKLQRFGNLILLISFVGILFSLLVVLDGAVGLLNRNVARDNKGLNLIFEANSVAAYHTNEFNFDASINSLGLRDREFQQEKQNKFRILCIGDSWTFGWGVNIEDSWPRRLEDYLHTAGYTNTEVINCGQSGQYTGTYKTTAARLLPVLKPDLVLIGVLQADDLSQSYEAANPIQDNTRKSGIHLADGSLKAVTLFFRASFQHTIHALRKDHTNEVIDITTEWKRSASSMMSNLNHLQQLRFNTFDDSLKQMFISGNLNPGLLQYYLDFPDRFYTFNDPRNSATKEAAKLMEKDIEALKNVCRSNNAKLVFLNLPEPTLTGHHVTGIFGNILNDYLYSNNHVDSIYASIARQARVPYFEMTDRFKLLTDKHACFYTYDGHPKARGYDEMARAISEYLIKENLLSR